MAYDDDYSYSTTEQPYSVTIGEDGAATPQSGDVNAWWRQLPQVVRDLYTSYRVSEAQQRIMDLNIERARRGQPPLPLSLATPQVNVGVSDDVRTMMMVGGALFLGVLVFGAARRRA